ncbi:hypothetical protein PGIGA_G00250510 [Pangasianodon gigas]|uniref:Uncharacterized protein n=1 Tax=Pangasianodon gigas TaxID=30993 RepID=A0ACC5WQD3_PANGG|nr:hypothetical protein [Pangasianodon gigas]
MGSVSSLIPGTKNCRGSDHKLKKGFQCKRGGLLKHGFSHDHNAKNNNNSKLDHGSAGTGNSDDFFYIKVSHKPRGDETPDDAGSRKTPTELSARLEQGIMGSVSSLIPGTKNCRGSDHKLKKGFQCKRGGLLKHGFSHDHNAKNNNNSKLDHGSAGTGNSDDFFYIKVSHKPRGDETPDDAGSRKTPTELSARLEQSAENSFTPQFPRSSSSSVETHNSLSTILGTNLSHIDRPKNQTPEPKHDMSSGSPCDSGISGSSWTNDGANSRTKWTGGVNGDGGTSNSSTRSTSVLSDCISGPASVKTDTAAKNAEMNRTSPFTDRNLPSSTESEVSEERQLYSSESAENSFTPQFPRSSSSSVETHNSLSTILGTNLSHIDRPKNQTPEPKHDMSSGSPCDSGISGSSWTNDGANSRTKWTGGVNGDGGTSNSSTRSTSVLSDCISGPASVKTDTAAKNAEMNRTSPFTDRNLPSSTESEVSEERQLYSSEVSQHALRAQQLLQLQVLQLQQDKDRLQEEVDQLIKDRDATESQLIYKHQHTPLTPTLEETQWEVCQKVGEISLLKQQLKDSQADVTSKLNEIVSLRAALRETRSKMEELEEKHRECEETLHLRSTEMEVCENELQRKKNEAELLREKAGKLETDVKTLKQDLLVAKEEHLELLSLKVQLQEQQHLLQICQSKLADQETSGQVDVLQKEVETLREQLEDEKQKKEKILSSFHREKQTWNKEKDKVIRYQKQLQFNYVQMHRKNQELEKKLNSKVDNRTEKDQTQEDTDVRKTEVRYDEMMATEI